MAMTPDITIWNATTVRPVITAHTEAGRTLLARHYDMEAEQIDWICIERVSTKGTRKFQELHNRIIRAHIIVRNDQASAARLDELTGGEYSARNPSPRVA